MKDNRFWILFGNGENSRITVSLHPGKEQGGRPADAYVVTGGGLSRSARRAAESVYHWLNQSKRESGCYVAGFDVLQEDGSMAGESGGLAFAIALAVRILKKNVNAAATGEILCSDFPGMIGRVDHIDDKLTGALALLSDGDFLFYPLPNKDDLDIDIRTMLEAKGIQLHGVASVAEALDLLFVQTKAPTQDPSLAKKRSKLLVFVAFLFLALGSACLMWLRHAGLPVESESFQVPEETSGVKPIYNEPFQSGEDTVVSEKTSTDRAKDDKGFD